ncbi:protein DpdE [Mycolicibacterium elephantis]|uniref:protein DpdE n=1 Tax=Mycolicibacterium elephantis TaxID=81858 RepID=UPI003A867285
MDRTPGSLPASKRPTKKASASSAEKKRSAKKAANAAGTKALTKRAPVRKAPKSGQRQILRIGDLIVSSANELGVGKAVGREGDTVILEYFDNPGQPAEERFRMGVPVRSIRRFRLEQEIRAFWKDKGGAWLSGRLDDINQYRDIVVLTAGGGARVLNERDVYIRWDKPLEDPVGFGASALMESPYLSDLRRPFMHHILRQRAAAHGIGSALASSIELHPHQLDAARRVLEDTTQRYLLADEVGLGKTIEAGIVIRQILTDYSDSKVQLVVPPLLREQWRDELLSKFNIADFDPARIRISRDDRPDSWAAADLLVVDEAHNLARLRTSPDVGLNARYSRLSDIALNSPRLLLLSATPVLHNEDVFLGMLRLLDPSLYRNATAEEVREKVSARAVLGRTLLGLKPSLPASIINRRLDELRTILAPDEDALTLIKSITEAVAARDTDATAHAVNELQAHVSEVHRVHRRMIRTRRTEGLRLGYRVQGRTTPDPSTLVTPVLRLASNLIDEWRQYAVASVETGLLDESEAGQLLAKVCSLLPDPIAVALWADDRLQGASSVDETEILERMSRSLRDTDRRREVSAPIADLLTNAIEADQRIVIFCATTSLAAEIANAIADLVDPVSVGVHLETSEPEVAESTIRTFDSGRIRYLVCDRSAEEGRNLQSAHVIAHVGLPSDINRLEQRIGRTDRWTDANRSTATRSLCILSSNELSWDQAWFKLALDGFEVFTRSVASLQHAIEESTASAWRALLLGGVEATYQVVDDIKATLAEELENVREQDALDSREMASDSRAIFAEIRATEADESIFAEVTDHLLPRNGRPGNLRLTRVGNPRSRAGSYSVMPDHRAQPPLIPLWRLRRDFIPLEGQQGTFRRPVAVSHPEVRLFRYGSPFIDAVADFIWHDDRGRAFGMWRFEPEWKYEELVAYRFDYHIEADLSRVSDSISQSRMDDSRALLRRADALFPPAIETVWIDRTGEVISDPNILSILDRPYVKPQASGAPGDLNLDPTRMEGAFKIVPRTAWEETWRTAEFAARETILGLERVQQRIFEGRSSAENDHQVRRRQLTIRESHSSTEEASALAKEIVTEDFIAQALLAGISTPKLQLDSTGVVILAGYSFDGLQEESPE